MSSSAEHSRSIRAITPPPSYDEVESGAACSTPTPSAPVYRSLAKAESAAPQDPIAAAHKRAKLIERAKLILDAFARGSIVPSHFDFIVTDAFPFDKVTPALRETKLLVSDCQVRFRPPNTVEIRPRGDGGDGGGVLQNALAQARKAADQFMVEVTEAALKLLNEDRVDSISKNTYPTAVCGRQRFTCHSATPSPSTVTTSTP